MTLCRDEPVRTPVRTHRSFRPALYHVSPARSPSGPTRRAARLLDPLVQLWSLCLLQSGHLDVPGPVGGSEWRWGVEVCTAEEDDIHRNVVGGQLYDPAKFW